MTINNICCIGAGYVGGPTMAVIADKCNHINVNVASHYHWQDYLCELTNIKYYLFTVEQINKKKDTKRFTRIRGIYPSSQNQNKRKI